jgi:hypothetical protein
MVVNACAEPRAQLIVFDIIRPALDNAALLFFPFPRGPLAQSVEQLAFNQLVGSSNLPRPTIFA